MKNLHRLDINEIEKYYTVTEDGRVWSKIKDRWLTPHDNIYGYVFYSISKGVDKTRTVFAHTLVALKYLGEPPTPRHEIDHKDDNKANNYYENLQWMTHSENQLKAYANGRTHYWLGKKKGSPDIITRMKMANAKKKRIKYTFSGGEVIYESIEEAAMGLGTYRKRIYNGIKNGLLFRGGVFSEIKESFDDYGTPVSLLGDRG